MRRSVETFRGCPAKRADKPGAEASRAKRAAADFGAKKSEETMSCPTCDHTMQCVVAGAFWGPRCGSITGPSQKIPWVPFIVAASASVLRGFEEGVFVRDISDERKPCLVAAAEFVFAIAWLQETCRKPEERVLAKGDFTDTLFDTASALTRAAGEQA